MIFRLQVSGAESQDGALPSQDVARPEGGGVQAEVPRVQDRGSVWSQEASRGGQRG